MENSLILNREFQLPADGFYHIAPLGEFPNAAAGVVQVIDRAACEVMTGKFALESSVANFGGVLVDFDHGSLDTSKSSEASGWVTALQVRDDGLYANIRWSDTGEAAVKGGRYRYVSPVWARSDCEDLGDGRVRPLRLLNLAVTNDPNLKGMVPLSNRSQKTEVGSQKEDESGKWKAESGDQKSEVGDQEAEVGIRNAAVPDAEKRLKWVLGDSKAGPCVICSAAAGQVHTLGEWNGAGLTLPVHLNCACSLVETELPATGSLVDIPARHEVVNAVVEAPPPRVVRNVGWTEQARLSSLAVRKAKSASRGGAVPAEGKFVRLPGGGRGLKAPDGPVLLPEPVPTKPVGPGKGVITEKPGPGGGPPEKSAKPGRVPMPVLGSPEWITGQLELFERVQFRAFLDETLSQLVVTLAKKRQTEKGLSSMEAEFMRQAPGELARRSLVVRMPGETPPIVNPIPVVKRSPRSGGPVGNRGGGVDSMVADLISRKKAELRGNNPG